MASAKSEEVSLLIDDQVFKVNKDVLCEHSDYFRAMFSGNYIEQEQHEISIDVVNANSMNIIMRYMTLGLIDLSEFTLSTIGELVTAVNFLQITELIKQIEYCLELRLTMSNWLEIMSIAEDTSFKKLEDVSAAYGLYNFKRMKPEFIQSVHKLVWYLSHSHLNTDSELLVFKFGLDWILLNENSADALLLIIGCLDLSKITKKDLHEIKGLTIEYVNSLAEKVVHCLCKLVTDFTISVEEIRKNQNLLCEMYTGRVFTEVLNLVTDSKKRHLEFKTCVALWPREQDIENTHGKETILPNWLYTLHENDTFHPFLEVTDMDLWGWNVVGWGVTKLVIVGGEHGRGTGSFWKRLKVYDVLKKEWTEHGVELPLRRHAGVAILDDSLYMIGGVGGYRVVLDTAIIYNLKERSFRKIAKLPDAIQSPTVCVHEKQVYASGHKNIYRYDDHGENDRWITMLETDFRPSCMVSYKGYIYCTQRYHNYLFRFRPDIDKKLELVSNFEISPSTICVKGDKLLAFANTDAIQLARVTIAEISEKYFAKPKVIWSTKNSAFTINDVAGSCAIVDTIPPVKNIVTQYLKRYLANYEMCYSK